MGDFPRLEAVEAELEDLRVQLNAALERISALASEVAAALNREPQPDDGAEEVQVDPIVPEHPADSDPGDESDTA